MVCCGGREARGLRYEKERRQELEERERNGETPTPLLSPEEGAALVRSATRCVGAVS